MSNVTQSKNRPAQDIYSSNHGNAGKVGSSMGKDETIAEHTHKKHISNSADRKVNENTSTMMVFTFFAALVAVALVAFILVEVFNLKVGDTSDTAGTSSGETSNTSSNTTSGTSAPVTAPAVSNNNMGTNSGSTTNSPTVGNVSPNQAPATSANSNSSGMGNTSTTPAAGSNTPANMTATTNSSNTGN